MQALATKVEIDDTAADGAWARQNLRFDNGRLLLDLANCLRVIERHPDFKGRYRYNDVLAKVMDRGAVMVEWRLGEFATLLQERFMPELPYEIAARALAVAANRASQK